MGHHGCRGTTAAAMVQCVLSRVAYWVGIFRSVSVGISRYLPYRYRRKTRSVHFGIKKGAIAPFFPQKGGNSPLFDEDSPPFKEKRGERYEKGGNNTDQKYRYRANLIRYRVNTDTEKMTGTTMLFSKYDRCRISTKEIVCLYIGTLIPLPQNRGISWYLSTPRSYTASYLRPIFLLALFRFVRP